VHREFEDNCVEAGIARDPEALRRSITKNIPYPHRPLYMASVLDRSPRRRRWRGCPHRVDLAYERKEVEASAGKGSGLAAAGGCVLRPGVTAMRMGG
jgi:hypothetical protein